MEKDGLIENIRDALKEKRNTNTHRQTDTVDRRLIALVDALRNDRLRLKTVIHTFNDHRKI